ncbi:MAG: TlpA family protein disulfide reductase [Bacteroidales bacterium]|nr:TlpA family protein disulfide reductase [Bacteroidales bacterium]
MKIIILLTIFALYENINHSGIPVVDFDTFEPRLHLKNDTTYVINFWASWCLPCREELPDLEKLHRSYYTKKVKVILVSLDMPDQIESRLVPFLEKNNITAPTILLDDPDFNRWINKIDNTWGGAIPATLIYNKEGRVFLNRKTHYEELENIIQSNTIKP